ncbi:MAG: T9SS type A sorting domain-containing protein, partial [Chloroherpetonaceae bacterium]
RFDGSNDYMQLATHLTDSVGTLMMVGRKTAVGTGYRTMFTSKNFLMLGRTNLDDFWGAYNNGNNRLYTPNTSIGSSSAAAFRVLGYIQRGIGAGQLDLFLDGTISSTGLNGGGNGKSVTTIGSNNAPAPLQYFPGDIAEVVFYGSALNAAQRIIVENYLSSKYNIPIANDRYAGDTPANGDYDFDVKGIGTSDGTSANRHSNTSKGGGLNLQERNSSLNASNEYLLCGHNGIAAVPTSASDLPSGVAQRWSRIWYFDKTGTIDAKVLFDFKTVGASVIPANPANYRLLYRSGLSGTFSEVTIVGSPTIVDGTQVAFDVDDANLPDGYYTIGTTNPVDSPLPVELVAFTLSPKERGVLLQWQTASETDNMGFILSRSLMRDGSFQEVASYRTNDALKGLGTSPTGKTYSYFDNSGLQAGRTYFYKLADVDLSGNITEHPIRAITLPNDYSLSQNYPNPFNPTTTIEFSLRQDGRTTLEVFNLLGQRVAVLVDGILKAGAYQYPFNATHLASGMYFYRLRSGEFMDTKKMMLVK